MPELLPEPILHAIAPRNGRCPHGQMLWLAIDLALAFHEPEQIYHALVTYFTHKNGQYNNPDVTPCAECRGRRP